MRVGNVLDFLNNYNGFVKLGETIFDNITKKLNIYNGIDFESFELTNEINSIKVFAGNMVDFDTLHQSGIHNVTTSTANSPLTGKTGLCFTIKRNTSIKDDENVSAKEGICEIQIFLATRKNLEIRVRSIEWLDGALRMGSWKVIYNGTPDTIEVLNTPYHTLKMQQEGVCEDFIQYMDSKIEYDRLQREQPEGVMMLPVLQEPQPSEKLLAFKEKYLG